ncbi:MAG: GxxExxY protein [Planctomycetaceae bacterium]|jgi:GxxExxY protein
MNKILYREESYAVNGAIFEVYREMGCGFLEPVYQECLAKEFALCGIPHRAKPELRLTYKHMPLERVYEPDFICYDTIIIELKAVKEIAPEHQAQILNYLKATGLKLGLLVNFGAYPKAVIQRFAF